MNFLYGKEAVQLNSFSVCTRKQEEFVCLNYLSMTQDNIIRLSCENVDNIESYEKEILRLLEQSDSNEKQKFQRFEIEPPFLEKQYEFSDSYSFVSDGKLAKVIKERITEIETAVKNNMPLAAMFLIGSTLEGVLSALAQKYPQLFNKSPSVPKKNGNPLPIVSWVLESLIDVAYGANVLSKDVVDFSKQVRNYRNYIHPREQVRQNFSPTMDTVKISLQVFKAALNQIIIFDRKYGRKDA